MLGRRTPHSELHLALRHRTSRSDAAAHARSCTPCLDAAPHTRTPHPALRPGSTLCSEPDPGAGTRGRGPRLRATALGTGCEGAGWTGRLPHSLGVLGPRHHRGHPATPILPGDEKEWGPSVHQVAIQDSELCGAEPGTRSLRLRAQVGGGVRTPPARAAGCPSQAEAADACASHGPWALNRGREGRMKLPTSGCAAPPLLRRAPGGRDEGPRSPSAGAVCPQGEPQGAGLGAQEGSGAPDILPSSPLPSGPASPRLPPPCGTCGEVTPGGRHVHRDRSRGRSPNPVRGHSLPQEGAGPGVLPREPPGVRPAWTPLPSLAAA